MANKLNIDGVEYDLDSLTDSGKSKLASINFVDQRIAEVTNMCALLNRAKKGYIDSLKKELLTNKTGFFFDDD